MALSKQIHIYSVDTSAFYTDVEIRAVDLMHSIKKKVKEIKDIDRCERSELQKSEYTKLNKKVKKIKGLLTSFISKNDDIRDFRDEYLRENNVISIFESSLTRISGYKTNELTEDMIVVKTFYYGILEDLIKDGFYINDEKYVFFIASSGQIRTKKTVFIKEKSLNKNRDSLTCGLNIEDINKKGGINVNKYLAYLALTNSATDMWEGFDIDRCIVVDDFETSFNTNVDFIDEKTYEIETDVNREITIPHMDGCGILLPKLSRKSFMVRLPWVKGLLVPFQFNSFVRDNINIFQDCNIIKDIYGKEYDIYKDNIEIILTKSQFKMWKYYESWDHYKDNFKKYNCEASVCNIERDHIKNAKINYQMIQTLSDITDDELIKLSEKLNKDIEMIYKDRDTMLKVLGVTKYNNEKNSVQQILEIYPEILQDEHFRQILRDTKNKLVKQGRGGRFPIEGKYTFLVPDLYAFCQWLFLRDKNPSGLLKNGEVSCKLYGDRKLDVLRSPHLWMEHAIRNNFIDDMTKKYFITKGIYTSVHDPISRILQFDNDGDTALVCSDDLLISIAERNIKNNNVLPLYYEMAKADNQNISNEVFYDGMINAYSGGNIGSKSNDITKIWNSDNINLEAIKYLCMETNFVIDYAKTLYKPERPEHIDKLIKSYTKTKVPHFFKYVKEKTEKQVEKTNQSAVNRLDWIVKDQKFNFKRVALQKFDYRMLMSDKNVKYVSDDIIDIYNKVVNDSVSILKLNKGNDRNTNEYGYKIIRDNIIDGNYGSEKLIVDMLIIYLFSETHSKRKKKLFFECFSDDILVNLKNNIKKPLGSHILCDVCGKRIRIENNKTLYCEKCAKKIKNKQNLKYYHEARTKLGK